MAFRLIRRHLTPEESEQVKKIGCWDTLACVLHDQHHIDRDVAKIAAWWTFHGEPPSYWRDVLGRSLYPLDGSYPLSKDAVQVILCKYKYNLEFCRHGGGSPLV